MLNAIVYLPFSAYFLSELKEWEQRRWECLVRERMKLLLGDDVRVWGCVYFEDDDKSWADRESISATGVIDNEGQPIKLDIVLMIVDAGETRDDLPSIYGMDRAFLARMGVPIAYIETPGMEELTQ